MTQESARTTMAGDAVISVESLPFSSLPGQSRLFLDYLNNPLSLQEFYPGVVAGHTDVRSRVPEVLAEYRTDREALCGVLLDQNRRFSAGPACFENVEKLRRADCVAVVTGQQAGLFTGPLYTIYKALSAIKMAECLNENGIKAVPVFWVASEDHDFDEVAAAQFIDSRGELCSVENRPAGGGGDLPVGYVKLDGSIDAAIESLGSSLPATPFTRGVTGLLSAAWNPGRSFSDSFAAMLARLFSEFGLVLIDPLDQRLKELAVPIYSRAVESAVEINAALQARGKRLEEAGYDAQVKVDAGYFPLFWHDDLFRRRSLRLTGRGTISTKDRSIEFSPEELKKMAEKDPMRFSPGVTLRPVVQDWLLPTVCYFGGAAEIAYFAQNSEVYRILGRPAATILHRQSFTIVEARMRRTLNALGIEFTDLFKGREAVKLQAAKDHLGNDSARVFADAEERINSELNKLDQYIATKDPTIAANLAKRRRKIMYHISALREKFYRSQLRKDKTLGRRIDALFIHLYPKDQLQERSLNISYFLDQYGPNLIAWLYGSIDLDDRGHRLVNL